MQQVRLLKTCGAIGDPIFVDQERKRDAGMLAKHTRVVPVPQTDRRKVRTHLFETMLVFAQLRDVLAAKNSTVVAEKNQNRRPLFP